jgi:3-phenylpropionate/trans-cinnamate dioxygenase ferredoxin reductase subunit
MVPAALPQHSIPAHKPARRGFLANSMTDDIVIVGAGQAGVQAVASLRAEGFSGSLALIGDEPFPPYQRPPLSKAYLAGDLVRERLFLKPESFFPENNCDLRLGVKVARIEPETHHIHLATGDSVSYGKLLLATGARVRRISVPGTELSGIHYLRGIEDVDLLRPLFSSGKHLVVVGGGYIGLEVAAVAVKHGLKVTILEAAARVMERAVSAPLSKFYQEEHAANGVDIRLGLTVEGFEGKGRVEKAITTQDSFDADIVLVGIGVVPHSELAEQAGLVTDNGIVVDKYTKTSDPNIFAAGDCTNHPTFLFGRDNGRVRLESVQNAIDQAKHAALAMMDRPQPYHAVPWFWSDQYDLKLQIAGLARQGDELVVRGDPVDRNFAVFHLAESKLTAVEAVNAAPEYVVGRKLIVEGKKIAADQLLDTTIAMKSFL